MKCYSISALVFIAGASLVGCAAPATGHRVRRVIDGGTFEADCAGKLTTVRIYGIKVPELTEPGGEGAKRVLYGLIDGRRVQLSSPGPPRDYLGRKLASVRVGEMDIGQELVRRGIATALPLAIWIDKPYSPPPPSEEVTEAVKTTVGVLAFIWYWVMVGEFPSSVATDIEWDFSESTRDSSADRQRHDELWGGF